MRLIDADELKEAMNEHTDYKGYLVCDPEEIIDLAPTVERPHGEWIKTGRTNIYDGFEIECSHCHNKLMVSPKRWEVGENFCDVCGSQNKEVKRNEVDN